MDYKGYSLYEAHELLLYDILQTQQDILTELKKMNSEDVSPVTVPEDAESNDELIADAGLVMGDTAKIEWGQPTDTKSDNTDIPALIEQTTSQKPVNKPVQKKSPTKKKSTAKKKTQSKKATK